MDGSVAQVDRGELLELAPCGRQFTCMAEASEMTSWMAKQERASNCTRCVLQDCTWGGGGGGGGGHHDAGVAQVKLAKLCSTTGIEQHLRCWCSLRLRQVRLHALQYIVKYCWSRAAPGM